VDKERGPKERVAAAARPERPRYGGCSFGEGESSQPPPTTGCGGALNIFLYSTLCPGKVSQHYF